jgi:hypothetical protein
MGHDNEEINLGRREDTGLLFPRFCGMLNPLLLSP